MQWKLVAVALVVGCGHPIEAESALTARPAAVPGDAAPVAPDAVAPDAAAPDAAAPDAADDPDYWFYEHEALGPLHTQMTEAELVAVLGQPKQREKPFDEPATAAWVSTWSWPDAMAGMIADHATGPWTARSVSIRGASKLATKRGIHLGSTRAQLEHAYPRSPDDREPKPDHYLVGSVYGGMLFYLDHDRVIEIDIGPFAF